MLCMHKFRLEISITPVYYLLCQVLISSLFELVVSRSFRQLSLFLISMQSRQFYSVYQATTKTSIQTMDISIPNMAMAIAFEHLHE